MFISDAIADNLVGKRLRIFSLQRQNMGLSGREKARHKDWRPYTVQFTNNPSDYTIRSPALSGTKGSICKILSLKLDQSFSM